MLAEIHSLLGELQMENCNFKASIEAFEKSIDYSNTYLIENTRDLAYFHFICVVSSEKGNQLASYQLHLQTTVSLLYKRLVDMLKCLGICPKDDNIEETLQSVNDALANETLKRVMGSVMYEDMIESKAILDDVLSKQIKLVEEEMKENARSERFDTRTSITLHNESNKENKPIQSAVNNNRQILETLAKNSNCDLLKCKSRKRTFGQAGIRDDQILNEPKSKKFRTQ